MLPTDQNVEPSSEGQHSASASNDEPARNGANDTDLGGIEELDSVDDIEFTLEEIENQIAPLALA